MKNETIAAIATPPGSGGIGIIRISGGKTRLVMEEIFRRAGNEAGHLPPHRLCYGHIVAPESDRVIDEVLAVLMPKPASYTREDVAEIQAHAGPAVLEAILDLILSRGVRLAEPGEFTRRAFMNGRIDLTQAEGIIDIITAGTDRALAAASAQMRGAIGRKMEALRNRLLEILGELEAAIDFPDDIEGEKILPIQERIADLKKISDRIEEMIARSRDSRIVREGLKVVVLGRPNVGKSSLMNALLGQERAIVTPIPGTTRDAIEAPFAAGGMVLSLIDTAGIHESRDTVERIGIHRTRQCIQEADLLIFVLEGSEFTADDRQIYGEIQKKPKIILLNKWDLVKETAPIPETPFASGSDKGTAWAPGDKENDTILKTSALFGEGIDELRMAIGGWVQRLTPDESPILPNLRHGALLASAQDLLTSAIEGFKDGIPPDLIAIDIREAIRTIGKITGEEAEPDLLDEIFSRFCIGK